MGRIEVILLNSIIIRNDDVLLSSTAQYDNSFKRFKYVHETVCLSPQLKHIPAIVTEEIQEFPEAIDYIQLETKEGRMFPELHGLRHIDYGALSEQEVIGQLSVACDWFVSTLGYKPLKWYTPWGANQSHLHDAAQALGLKAIDCSGCIKFKGRYGVTQLLNEGRSLSYFENKEIIMHWWNALDVKRLEFFVKKLNEAHTPN